MPREVKIIDCECNGLTCCGGRGIAVFLVERNGKKLKLCTRCDLSSDKKIGILKYVTKIPVEKLKNFDLLGYLCVADHLQKKDYPLV